MRAMLAVSLIALLPAIAFAQNGSSVKQNGNVTPGHSVMWTSNGTIQDSGSATAGLLTELGVTKNGGCAIGINQGPLSAPFNQMCAGVDSLGGYFNIQNFGGLTSPTLRFIINGVTFPFTGGGGAGTVTGPSSSVDGDAAVFNGITGTVIKDGGPILSPTGDASQTKSTATGGTTQITNANRFGYTLNVRDNGAVADFTPSTQTVTISANSNDLTAGSAIFSQASVGKIIGISGAFTTATTGIPYKDLVNSPGSGYTGIPTCAVSDSGGTPGTGATCRVWMSLQSITKDTNGSGCTNGLAQTFYIVSNGTAAPAGTVSRVKADVSGGVVSGAFTLDTANPGFLTKLPTTLSSATIFGGGCSVEPTADLSYGVGGVEINGWGNGAYNPATTTVALTGGSPSVAAVLFAPTVRVSSFPLVTTIASFISPTHVTLAANATHGLSAQSELIFTATDNQPVVQALVNTAIGLGLPLYFPASSGGSGYYFNTPIDPGAGPLTVRGDGMNNTVLVYHGGTAPGGVQTGSFYPMFKNIEGSPTALKNSIQFEDFQIMGLFDYGEINVGAQAVNLDNYRQFTADRIKIYKANFMGINNHSNYGFTVLHSVFDQVPRDQARCSSCFNDNVSFNYFIHGGDNAIALHTASTVQGQGVLRDSMVVEGNILEDTAGISALGARELIVRNNICKRNKFSCTFVAPNSTEGVNPIFSVDMSGNENSDSLSIPPFVQPQTVFSVSVPLPASVSTEPRFVPGVGFTNLSTTNYNAAHWEYSNVNVTTGLEPVPPAYQFKIQANSTHRKLPDTALYSSWGYGQLFTANGWMDVPVFGIDLEPIAGINSSLNIIQQNISDNHISDTQRCIAFSNEASFPAASNIDFTGNSCFNTWEYGFVEFSAASSTWRLYHNTFNMDPYRMSGVRSGSPGGWNFTTTSIGISASGSSSIATELCGNTFQEMYQVSSGGLNFTGGCPNLVIGNLSTSFTGTTTIAGATSPTSTGMAIYPSVGGLWQMVDVNSQGNSATPNLFNANLGAHLSESIALPTGSGTRYFQGDRVKAVGVGPLLCGCSEWVRLTTGSGNVLGTDWLPIFVTDGPTTVAGLGACTTVNDGQPGFVTDATSPTFNGALTGGGAVETRVHCVGSATAWFAG